jgi:hypothetical protein
MFFEERVEQHRVHRIVAHRVRLSICIACNQVWGLPFPPVQRRAARDEFDLVVHCARQLRPHFRAPARREQQASSNRKFRGLGGTLKYPNFASGMEKSVLPAAGDCLRDS